MQTTLPVALSAQLAAEKRLDTIANNLANSRTAGFRSEEVKFEQLLSTASQRESVAFASSGETYLSTRSGELTQTGNALDVAVSGEAFLAIQTPRGPVYTRDGRMQMLDTGELQTLNGESILDVGGAPILLDPAGGAPSIARDGMITQNGVQLGALGLFQMAPGANLTRAGTSGVVPDRAPVPVVEFADTQVLQGFQEGSNVNPILEMTRMIAVQRAFEQAANLIQTSESSLGSAISMLGAPK
ncbi:flagellar basal-body rod protein FlgF [Aureimonas jatrophae]|uniref:Flagellar basal-body rod protein FlgF n=1 Tax=Aureimonas jatrophae TaxID=1166073 RepID=A0A1H0JE58_9HYPH|nr:flagellar basal-body rod protein FlgF [Aureimonas jatrophae]MBB3951455.1 flagellar basal-body rod protein FlgF [Aureimonas jatrophae]SDO41914.1 flagellar basal-body rod protein FlgF [Aureimonas jatrophae]